MIKLPRPDEKEICKALGFDPDWSFEQAQKAGAEGRTSPFSRWLAWQELKEHRKEYENGNHRILFSSIYLCSYHLLPPPLWLADAYSVGYNKWNKHEPYSLDEAFDVVISKGKHKNKLKKDHEKKLGIYFKVIELNKLGSPIDEGLFTQVGEKYRMSAGSISALYYQVKKEIKTNRNKFHLQKKD